MPPLAWFYGVVDSWIDSWVAARRSARRDRRARAFLDGRWYG